MNMATAKPRYTVSVDNELFQQIEDFRFERRFQTRSEATVELIRLGLEQLKKEEAAAKEAREDENLQ
jgi:metal-responsive CopG/Arc/MetJ family transcriptional regulator